jgi:hypothetical protein
MLALVLKLDEEKIIIESDGRNLIAMLEALRESTILDSEGDTWIIAPDAVLYFEAYPPHFEIACKQKN